MPVAFPPAHRGLARVGSAFALAVALPIVTPRAQIASRHHLVLTSQTTGSALLDVDSVTGVVRTLPRFALDRHAPLACTWDPIGRHAVVAVAGPAGSIVARGAVSTKAALPLHHGWCWRVSR